jgi:SAM-dependent methyltransferase
MKKSRRRLGWSGRLLLRLRPRPRGRLLDVGCGEGLFLSAASAHYRVAGIDIDRNAVRAARRLYGLEEVKAVALKEFAVKNDVEPFDVVTMFDVLEHLEDPGGHLRAVRELMAPEGCLALSVPNRDRKSFRDDMRAVVDHPPNHLTRWNSVSLRSFLEAGGFRVLRLYSRRSDLCGYYESEDILPYRLAHLSVRLGGLFGIRKTVEGVRESSGEGEVKTGPGMDAGALRRLSALLWFPLWLPLRLSGQASYRLWVLAEKKRT